MSHSYPSVYDVSRVGSYPARVYAGGGYVWDEVLEYRVWCHPENGAVDANGGNDYYRAFSSYEEAVEFSQSTPGTEEPLALILQREFIDEPIEGEYVHVKKERVAEWPVQFLNRPRRTPETLPTFFAPNAPSNRLAIIRGIGDSSESNGN